MQDHQDDPDVGTADDEAPMDVFDKLWEFLKALVRSFLEGWGRY